MSPLEAAKLPSDALWTVEDVMAYLRASRSWIYQRVADGRLPCLRVGGLLRFKAEAVKAWAEGTAPSAPVLTLKGGR